MTDLVEEVLKEIPRLDKLILPTDKKEPMLRMPKQWQLLVDELIDGNVTAGKHRITVHSLRHTHASWLALAGTDILKIKEQLGHKKLDMTLRYSHLIPDERHKIAKQVFDVA
jgi:integrase